jgi:hypothetical protein
MRPSTLSARIYRLRELDRAAAAARATGWMRNEVAEVRFWTDAPLRSTVEPEQNWLVRVTLPSVAT